MAGKPKWAKPERQAHLVNLFLHSGGFCIFGHKPCRGAWTEAYRPVCHWGLPCSEPHPEGALCKFKPTEPHKPRLPCHYRLLRISRWRCAYGDYPCYRPFEAHYENWANGLIKDWVADDRAQVKAEWQALERAMHGLAERKPERGQFNATAKDAFYAEQPQYYIEGLGVSGLTFTAFVKVRLASSYVNLFVDIGKALKAVSKHRKRKAVRYGKALPKEAQERVDEAVSLAVRDYLARS